MRTRTRAGELRSAEHVGETVAVCGWVASRRDHGGVVFLDLRDTAGIVQVVVDPEHGVGCRRTRRARRVRAAGRGRGARPAGGHGERRPAHRRRRGRGDAGRGAERVRARRRSRSTSASEADEVLRLRHRYLDLRSERTAAQPPAAAPSVNRAIRGGARRARLRRGRDADAHRVDARRARATSSCRRACRPGRSTRCRRARSCSSSC